MEIIPFLIFAVIAFNIFRGFTKAGSSGQGKTAKAMMKDINAQIQQGKTQGRRSNLSNYQEKSPTARGRERMALKNQNSPWGHEHDLSDSTRNLSPGAKVAGNYIKKTQTARKESHKNEEQHGRRGINIDQNRHRSEDWGERGDSGFLNGKILIALLIIGGAVLIMLSKMPAT